MHEELAIKIKTGKLDLITLKKLKTHENPYIRSLVAEFPLISLDDIRELCADSDPLVVASALNNEKIPKNEIYNFMKIANLKNENNENNNNKKITINLDDVL